MILKRRRQSSSRLSQARAQIFWWLYVLFVSLYLLSRLDSVVPPAPHTLFQQMALLHLFLPLLIWTRIRMGVGWAAGATLYAGLLSVFVGLSCRQSLLLWLPLEWIVAGLLLNAVLKYWQGTLAVCGVNEEGLQEEINALEAELPHLEENLAALRERLERYKQLRRIANVFSISLSFDDLLQKIVQLTGQVVEKGTLALLYLVNPKTLTLELKSVWRKGLEPPIKAKTGDPFDLWVMRQAQPLLVEEPAQDFRFAQIQVKNCGRSLGALVAAPLISESRFLGVLRVESNSPRGLGQEELRLVRIIADLASLGIENSLLFSRMAELAMTDDLTGLGVKSYFQKRFSEELSRAKALDVPVSILLIDIDRFKEYNDTFGHSAGDKLLKHLAQLLALSRRPGDLIARFGGEEFVCLFPGMNPVEAAQRAERLRLQIEAAQMEVRRAIMKTTVSIGVASFPQDGGSVEDVLRAADQRLYRAKNAGRNQVCPA